MLFVVDLLYYGIVFTQLYFAFPAGVKQIRTIICTSSRAFFKHVDNFFLFKIMINDIINCIFILAYLFSIFQRKVINSFLEFRGQEEKK